MVHQPACPGHNNTQHYLYTFNLLTTSEFPLLLKSCLIALCGQAVLICSALPSLLIRVRSEFQSSKLEGGKKGGITAFNLSLGSLVNGALLLNWKRKKKRRENRNEILLRTLLGANDAVSKLNKKMESNTFLNKIKWK